MHLGLWLASLGVRADLLRSLTPFAPAFRWAAERFKDFGSDRGGMLVEVAGLDARGNPARAVWSLVAEGGDGPVVPTLPALAAIRALTEGRLTEPGAQACVGVLELAAIEREFSRHRIATQIVSTAADAAIPVRAAARV